MLPVTVRGDQPSPEREPTAQPSAKPTGLVEGVSNVVTAVLGLAAFVYVSGAAVLWIRLWAIDVPANPVVTGLPRELLIGTGLRTVVLPSLALAVFAAAGFGLGRLAGKIHGWVRAVLWALLWTLIGASIMAALLWGPTSWTFWIVGAAVAFFLGYMGSISVGGLLSEASEFAIVALVLFAVGLVGAGLRIALELENHGLPRTVVCVNDGGTRYLGFLIGESSDAVYVGQRFKKRLVAVSKDRVGEVYIGPARTPCTVPKPKPPPPPAPPPTPAPPPGTG